MLQAMFSGVSGLQAHQTRMSVIGNNIANVNTIGFKAGRASFQEQLSQVLRSASSPKEAGTGGLNFSQVGLGVTLGAIDTIQTQGNLQTTGKATDLAIQGMGFFVVSDGKNVYYTRDGSFDLDSSGALVNTATGQKLLGYIADANGNIDNSRPVSQDSVLRIPVGTLSNAKQTQNITFAGNLDASSALQSTRVDFTGNLNKAAAPTDTLQITQSVYDALGNAHTLSITFANPDSAPSGAGVPAGATAAWDVVVKVDGDTVYDSTAGKSRIYFTGAGWVFADTSTGASLGGAIQLDGGTASNSAAKVPGTGGASNFSVDLHLGTLTNAASTSTITGVSDGQAGGSPFWGTSIRVYDSLGVGHLITFTYTRVPLGVGGPTDATARWEWVAIENGGQIASSSDPGNSALFFDSTGKLVGGSTQTITITPVNGSISPFTIRIDNSGLGQLASDSTVSANTQDGYPAGTLQSFTISPDGLISGVFTSGLTRLLGQIAIASFSNPGGLEKLGSNLYRESANSGAAQVGVPNQGGRGKISPGFLEMSNVDLSNEFANLIITERGFQANTRIITVVDNLLQDVINIKR
jgi:flagellar hook protein FlgE